MIPRSQLQTEIEAALDRSPVVALLGPRQCGKTTLARQFLPMDSLAYFDLEDPRAIARLADPMLALESLQGVVVLDEVQLRPDLFSTLRVLVDRPDNRARFLVLGSAAPDLLRQSSETLAGRIEFIAMGGFHLLEVGPEQQQAHWLRGGFPRSFLAASDAASLVWRRNFLQTFVMRDIPAFGHGVDTGQLQRLWAMLAHYDGQLLNSSAIANSLGISDRTVRRYIDLLAGYYLVRLLKPWHTNLRKREVKAPKLYFRDTGLLHAQLGIESRKDLEMHPKLGASWETYALNQTLAVYDEADPKFWSVHSGAEIDLILSRGGRRFGVEFKRRDAPRLARTAAKAVGDLGLAALFVVYPRGTVFPLAERAFAVPLSDWLTRLPEILAPDPVFS